MTGRPQRSAPQSTLQEHTFPRMAAAPAGQSQTDPSRRGFKNLHSDTQSSTKPQGSSGMRARSDSMPVKNRDMSGVFADDLLRKISSKITKDSTGRGHDTQHDENSHLRAPLNSRMASRSRLDADKFSKQGGPQKAGTLSLQMQESAIIEDLLFTMMGIEGKYITMVHPSISAKDQDMDYVHLEFKSDESLDPSLRDLVSRILPLASIYLSLEAFVELRSRFEYGFVSHALCAAIRNLLKEYLILIAQLETQFRSSPDFTLQKLWYYIQPTMQTLSSLDVLVGVIREAGRKEPPADDIEALLNPKEGIPLESKGGSILAIIAAGMFNMSGDPVTKKLYGFLLNKASVPYIAMLESWIHKGEIRDPYEEFMIVESRRVKKEGLKQDFNDADAYWEQRYTIRGNYVPSFLVPHKTKILLAGKYLNVIRECGIHLSSSNAEQSNPATSQAFGSSNNTERNDVLAALSGGRLVDTIDEAYQYANRKLLDLLLEDKQLLGRLRSMKRYFFLDQSDYFTHFLDLASVELKRPWREVSLTKLQSLLDLVLRNPSSVTVNDTFKEDLKVDMTHLSLVDQLLRIISIKGQAQGQTLGLGDRVESKAFKARTRSRANSGEGHQQHVSNGSWQDEAIGGTSMEGVTSALVEPPTQTKGSLAGIDAFTLDYSVKFPLSLVISRKALTKYQLLFRHLLYLKHGEQVLCNTWTEHAKSSVWKNASPALKQWRGRVYGLRASMLTFVQQFAYYVCSEVLEPNWRDLASKLAKVSTVDQVLQIHSDFLDTCLNQCMLTNSKLLRIYSKLMSTCIKFTNYTDRFTRALMAMETQLDVETAAMAPLSQVQQIEKAMRRLNEFEDGFIYHLKLLIDALNFYSATETVQFLCLVVRLDYNQFYANQQS
ncbi:Spc98 family-domain-containing protein, partial [Gamsiella multidivaricata]|uniref:Spc98 family-domain-containing protein n=1 Tax=Gamsiella multidivaricata TaxID=101098 RepID=UPI00221EF242